MKQFLGTQKLNFKKDTEAEINDTEEPDRDVVFEGPVARTEKDRATERNRTDRNRTVGCGCSSPEIFSVAGLMV
jgi:hypothetical protein